MNVENIKKVRDMIAACDPANFNMSDFIRSYELWGKTAEKLKQAQPEENCGTACCLAGWAVTAMLKEGANPLDFAAKGYPEALNYYNIEKKAADYFGLSFIEARELFMADASRSNIREAQIQPSEAVAVLDNLVETGEVDWKQILGAERYYSIYHI